MHTYAPKPMWRATNNCLVNNHQPVIHLFKLVPMVLKIPTRRLSILEPIVELSLEGMLPTNEPVDANEPGIEFSSHIGQEAPNRQNSLTVLPIDSSTPLKKGKTSPLVKRDVDQLHPRPCNYQLNSSRKSSLPSAKTIMGLPIDESLNDFEQNDNLRFSCRDSQKNTHIHSSGRDQHRGEDIAAHNEDAHPIDNNIHCTHDMDSVGIKKLSDYKSDRLHDTHNSLPQVLSTNNVLRNANSVVEREATDLLPEHRKMIYNIMKNITPQRPISADRSDRHKNTTAERPLPESRVVNSVDPNKAHDNSQCLHSTTKPGTQPPNVPSIQRMSNPTQHSRSKLTSRKQQIPDKPPFHPPIDGSRSCRRRTGRCKQPNDQSAAIQSTAVTSRSISKQPTIKRFTNKQSLPEGKNCVSLLEWQNRPNYTTEHPSHVRNNCLPGQDRRHPPAEKQNEHSEYKNLRNLVEATPKSNISTRVKSKKPPPSSVARRRYK